MTKDEILNWKTRLSQGKESPSAIAEAQIELAAHAAYRSEQLKNVRNKKPEFFLQERFDDKGRKISNEKVEMLWQQHTKGSEVALKTEIEILDRFLTAAKSCLIALSIESRVQE